jgi:hypothetical protein
LTGSLSLSEPTMFTLILAFIAQLSPAPASAPSLSRPADIAFRVQMIDPGFSESVAVADFNKDGRLDILSAEYWYQAPGWTKHKIRDIPFNGSYIDNFSDLAVDVNGDGYTDIIQIAYFARRIVWLKNPGKTRMAWVETEIDAIGPTEFAFLVDLNNDGKALEILPQFTGAGKAPLTWYELVNGKWEQHVVSAQSRGHGIGAGDVNGDKRNDIITPAGWFEAPADVRAAGEWTLHAADWATAPMAAAGPGNLQPPPPGAPGRPQEYGFMYVIDINKDGRNDILSTMAHSYGVLWFEQGPNGEWVRHLIDNTWANAHSSALADLNGDGQLDLVAAKRYFGRGGADPSEREPMGIYWYQFRPGPKGTVEWVRHIIDYGGRAGGGLQMVVQDIDGDGDLDVITAGKTGLFLSENMTKGQGTKGQGTKGQGTKGQGTKEPKN